MPRQCAAAGGLGGTGALALTPMHDIAIVGAGPVGGTLALALAQADLDLAVIDARTPSAGQRSDRPLALSHGARLILERLDVWDALASNAGAVTPITAIDISQARGFGALRLLASEQQLPALGYVVSYAVLQQAIDAALSRAGIDVRFGTAATSVQGSPERALIATTDAEPLSARLAAVADGSGTAVHGIRRTRHDYDQVALAASVWLDRPMEGLAFERFTAEGPVALLPDGDHYGLIWTMQPERSAQLLGLDERAFLQALARHFGTRVTGFVRVASRRTFPLVLEQARPIVAARAVVLGNAAQQLHPVAGQGFNLGLRDAWELAQEIVDSPLEAIGTPAMLARYARRRRNDRAGAIAFTHGLVRLFGNDLALLRWPRGVSLAALDGLPMAKRAFVRTMLYGLR